MNPDFASALDLNDDAVFLIDRASMKHLEVNQAACSLLGLSREALMARRPNETSRSLGDLEHLGSLYDQVIAQSPGARTAEWVVERAEGRTCVCEVRHRAIRQADRWVIVTMLRDITERQQAAARIELLEAALRKAEEEIRFKATALARADEELKQFAYITSHDLTEPLRTIASYTRLLERRHAPQLDEDAREFMAYIVEGVQRMKAMMDDLLAFSRAGWREVPMHALPLDLAVDNALASLAPVIQRSHATVEREPLPTILGDAVAMTQVFQHLIGNALTFQAEGTAPHVKVAARDEGAEWVVEVRDNGIGIEPQYFKRIFMIFQKLHPRDRSEGTGIGLAICKKVVERHGGRITVVSELGRGATVEVHLPKPG
ncbi:ATP-binding protein [Variovorax soli]|uniref:histidine kinase n=1 Tax=Variovorax soli TaxID=376815 RepID=A0ABU1NEN0_9BURK|nr:ATP-binding protein [Variovorax soli]MDR6536915.1 PAS domain S-box-containing protein [Variovorax soli]